MDIAADEENTPTVVNPCRYCGRQVVELHAGCPAPANETEFWRLEKCCRERGGDWSACLTTGAFHARYDRVSYERRTKIASTYDGPERRRP